MIYLIRHGNRTGLNKESHTQNKDYYLTDLGVEQSILIAKHLHNKIEMIVTSPFTRCMQTASYLNQVTGVGIAIEDYLSEWINPDWFPTPPKYAATSLNHESEEDFSKRCEEGAEYLLNTYSDNVAWVSHAETIHKMTEYLTGKKILNQNIQCGSITTISPWSHQLKNGVWTNALIKQANVDHLQ